MYTGTHWTIVSKVIYGVFLRLIASVFNQHVPSVYCPVISSLVPLPGWPEAHPASVCFNTNAH